MKSSIGIVTTVTLLSTSISFNIIADEMNDDLFDLTLSELLKVRVTTGQRSSSTTYKKLSVPIHVITRKELEASGYSELGKILQRFDNSFNFPRAAITDLTDHARPASLRGLSPSHTLILVNGKRLHHSAVLHINNSMGRGSTSADINTIPLAAIERIEILQDGAAAQYGSDAIAGVINVILAKQITSYFSLTSGQTESGDGLLVDATLSNGGKLGEHGKWQSVIEFREREGTNRSENDVRQQYFTGDPRNDALSVNQQRYGDPDTSDRYLWLNGDYWLDNYQRLYFHGGWNKRKSDSPAFFRRPQDSRNVRTIYPDGFLPIIRADIDDFNLTLGWSDENEHAMDRWNWDLSFSYGDNRLDASVANSVNVSMGLTSPTHFKAGELISRLAMINGQATRQLQLFDRPLGLLIGAEWRQEFYQIKAGEPASYIHGGQPVLDGPNAGMIANAGAQGFPGFMPNNEIDVNRVNYALFSEAKFDVSELLTLQFAARYEHYSDFGDNIDGKLALAYTPNGDWLLRASASTGFRAPSLAQSSYRATSTSFFENESFDTGTFGVDEPIAQALGATALSPEESIHLGAGIVYYGIENLMMSVDFFNTQIDDRIILSGAITRDEQTFGPEVVAILQSYAIDGVRFFSNAIDTQTKGFDVKLDYDHQFTHQGTLHLAIHYHHNASDIVEGPRSPTILAGGTDVLFDRREQQRIIEGQPGDNVLFSATYKYNGWRAEWRQLRFGDVTTGQRNNDPTLDFTYDARWITDIDLSYQFDEKLRISAGAHNLFGKQPEYRNEVENVLFGEGKLLPYHQLAPFGFNGAFYYLRASYQF